MRTRHQGAAVLGLFALWHATACRGAPADSPEAQLREPVAREEQAAPRLVLWLTVDQMRGDYLDNYAKHFGDGGFLYLKQAAIYYENAHFGHAITETAPGHATLFTGVAPRDHGIIGNSWLLPDGTEVESVSDERVSIVGPGKGDAPSLPRDGRSPHRLLGETIGDVLVRETGGRAKVLAVSSKDRGAILPAGRAGQAFWLGRSGFVTSTHYEKAPDWVARHHDAYPPESYLAKGWDLVLSESDYRSPASVSGYAPAILGPRFPHQMKEGADPLHALVDSPFGDSAVIDFALAAIKAEDLGGDDVVDLLSLSLSSTDKIGHYYGPESREMEDQIARLDRELARFFRAIDESIGLKNVVIILSSDHGGCESAEHLQKEGGRRLTEGQLDQAARRFLTKSYGHDRYLLGIASPYVFLKRELVAKDGTDLRQLRRDMAAAMSALEGVHLAHPLGEHLPETELGKRLRASIHAERSGDIYVVPERYTLFLQSESLAATHGSPWEYDTHVPVLIAAPGVAPRRVKQPIDVRSLAPTVAGIMNINPPQGANFPALTLQGAENPAAQPDDNSKRQAMFRKAERADDPTSLQPPPEAREGGVRRTETEE